MNEIRPADSNPRPHQIEPTGAEPRAKACNQDDAGRESASGSAFDLVSVCIEALLAAIA